MFLIYFLVYFFERNIFHWEKFLILINFRCSIKVNEHPTCEHNFNIFVVKTFVGNNAYLALVIGWYFFCNLWLLPTEGKYFA